MTNDTVTYVNQTADPKFVAVYGNINWRDVQTKTVVNNVAVFAGWRPKWLSLYLDCDEHIPFVNCCIFWNLNLPVYEGNTAVNAKTTHVFSRRKRSAKAIVN